MFLHALQVHLIVQFGDETWQVQPQCAGVAMQVRVLQMMWMGEQQVVHFPKAALCAGSLGSLRGQ